MTHRLRRPRGHKDDEVFLEHMLIAIEELEMFAQADLDDVRTIRAIERAFEILGEAANNISDEFAKEHDDIPWRKIVGMRNWVIHAYFGTDLQVMQDTIKQDLPALRTQLETVKAAL